MNTFIQGPSWTREEFPESLIFRRRHTYVKKEEDKGSGCEGGAGEPGSLEFKPILESGSHTYWASYILLVTSQFSSL